MGSIGCIYEKISYEEIIARSYDFYKSLLNYKVLVFRDVAVDIDSHVRLMEKIYPSRGYIRLQQSVDHKPLFDLFANANLEIPNKHEMFARWHIDDSWLEYMVDINSISMQHLDGGCTGGNTKWVDLEKVYSCLDKDEIHFLSTVRVSNWNADEHPENNEIRKDPSEYRHMPLRTHPETNCNSVLYPGPSVFHECDQQWQEMLNKLLTVFENNEFIFEHTWQENDLVIWDNRNTAHCLMGGFGLGERVINKIEIGQSKPFYKGAHIN